MLKNLHKCIDDIVNEVSEEISNINFGGCGWFVYYICKEFENIGVEYSIINYNNKSELRNNLLFAKKNINFPDNKLGFHHLMVHAGNCTFDGTENYRIPPKYWGVTGVISFKDVFKLKDIEKYLIKEVWLSLYDVGQNKKLLMIIRKHIKRYVEKENKNRKA